MSETQNEQDQAAALIVGAGGVAQSHGFGFHVTTLWPGKQVGNWMSPSEVIREFEYWRSVEQVEADDPRICEHDSIEHECAERGCGSAKQAEPFEESPAEADRHEPEHLYRCEFHPSDQGAVDGEVAAVQELEDEVTADVADSLFRIRALADGYSCGSVYADVCGLGWVYSHPVEFLAPAEA